MFASYASEIEFNEGPPLYWDSRYEEEFYQGVMPPPTGEEHLHHLYAAPTVEMHPTDAPHVARILVPLTAEGIRSQPSTGRRITWRLRQRTKRRDLDVPCSVATLSTLALSLSVITFLVFFMLWTSLKDEDVSQESSWEEATEELGFMFKPFKVPDMITHSNDTRTLAPQV